MLEAAVRAETLRAGRAAGFDKDFVFAADALRLFFAAGFAAGAVLLADGFADALERDDGRRSPSGAGASGGHASSANSGRLTVRDGRPEVDADAMFERHGRVVPGSRVGRAAQKLMITPI